jgi:hypothetical protein
VISLELFIWIVDAEPDRHEQLFEEIVSGRSDVPAHIHAKQAAIRQERDDFLRFQGQKGIVLNKMDSYSDLRTRAI